MDRASIRGALQTLAKCLVLLLLVQHGDAFVLANYQQSQPQAQPPPPPQSQNPLGFLPNGYNLASGSPLAIQPPQYQQQLSSQLNQLPASNTNQLYSNNPSAEPSGPAANELDDGTSNKQFDSQYGRAGSSSQFVTQQQQQADSRLDRTGANSMSDREATPVFRFTGQALNSTSVKLVWSMTTGYQADFFEIRYGPIPDTESKSATLNGTARELTVSLLQANEMYHFKLQAFVNGSPVWKPLLQVIRTPPTGNTKPGQLQEDRELTPLGVKAEAKSNQTIQLSWVEQERPAHLTNARRVNFIRYHVDPSLSQEAAANGTNSSAPIRYHYLNTTEAANRDNRIIIQKLKPATEYAFAVRTVYFSPDGKKALKTSPFSMDTLAKTFDLEPSPPRNFSMMPVRLSADERGGELVPKLELTWAPPESPNGQLKGYVILYAHDLNQPDEKWLRIHVNDSNIFNWYVSNLRPGASYYFKMRAINQRGQSGDTETRMFMAPPGFPGSHLGQPPPIPANNILMLIVICLVAILFVLFLVVSRLFCRSHSSSRKLAAQRKAAALQKQQLHHQQSQNEKLANGYGIIAPPQHQANNSSSTVTGRVGTLARRSNRQQASDKPDFWISAMDQQAAASSDIKSNMSEKSNTSDNINMQAMVSLRRDSPQQFTTQTTQLAPMLPEYRFTPNEQQLMQQIQQQHQQQSHYHTGHQFPVGALGFDQMDNATASALMTLSKRQQQQLQKYHFQFASAGPGGTMNPSGHSAQAASPHQQPPPPPPLNIEQQQAQQQQQQQLHNQPLYGTHGPLTSTRSLRLHRPPVYDPVSGSFVQPAQQDPPNYNSHLNSMLGAAHHQLQSFNNPGQAGLVNTSTGSNTLQFHNPHSTSTLMSRRSTNTLRSFQSAAGAGNLYGQLGNATNATNQGPHLLQNHQAVINQLNDTTYPSMPLKHVSAVRPQIMSSLEDQIEMELAEKQAEQQQQQQQQQRQDQNS